MLTATLRLPNNNILRAAAADESTLLEEDEENFSTSERTIARPLHETNLMHQRCQWIRE